MSVYEISSEQGSVIYPIDAPAIKPEVTERILADGFRIKDEFHVTLVNSDYGSNLDRAEFAAVTDYFELSGPVQYEYWDELFDIDKAKQFEHRSEPRQALVAPMVGSLSLYRLLEDARSATGLELPQPFFHVTVATSPDTPVARRGIGIESREEWMSLQPRSYAQGWLA